MTVKSARELRAMYNAGQIVKGALAVAEAAVGEGVSTQAVNKAIEEYIYAQGAVPTFKGYRGFPAGACISVNSEVVHGIPSKRRRLRAGDIVSVDVGACFEGFHGDAARTFSVGQISDEAQRLIEITEKCFFAGLACATAGNRVGDISHAVQQCAEQNGFSVVRDFVGHGIGSSLHEPPDVPNFGVTGHGIRLAPGMTLAIEPMVNAGAMNVRVLSDGWTVVTTDGKNSAHYENTIAVTTGQPEILTL